MRLIRWAQEGNWSHTMEELCKIVYMWDFGIAFGVLVLGFTGLYKGLDGAWDRFGV